MKQYDIGIDLGTTSIIIATEEQGVVFRQPTIGAVDTRTNSILAVGDEALKMVGRAPAHIDLVRPLRDGIIQDHRMTNELIVRFVNQVCRSRIFKPRIAVCVPAAITGIEADALWSPSWRRAPGRSTLWTSLWQRRWARACRSASPTAAWSWTSAAAPPTLPSSAWAAGQGRQPACGGQRL